MKLLRVFAVALTVGLMPALNARASFVIDDFTNGTLPSTTLSNGVPRDVIPSPSVHTTASIGGGVLTASTDANLAFNETPSVRLHYLNFGMNDLSAFTGIETFVNLGTVTNNSLSNLTVNAFKNATGGLGFADTVTIAPGDSETLSFNFADTAAFVGLLVDFIGVEGQALDFDADAPLVLSAVPEPASLALLGFVAAGGGIVRHRRRTKVAKAVIV